MVSSHLPIDLRQVVGSLRSTGQRIPQPGGEAGVWPFITLSRQAGAGGHTLGTLLAERLNRFEFIGPRISSIQENEQLTHPWQCLDRELVERIAKDAHLSEGLIDSLRTSSHTWLTDFFHGLSHTDNQPSDLKILHRVAQTVRAVAQAGHVVLIGLGAIFMTRDMAGGIHLRLVAPLEHRIQFMAKQRNISESRARTLVQTLDADREAYFHRFWPRQAIYPELFHLTLNSGLMHEEQMVDCVLPLIKPLLHEVRD